MRAEFFLEIVSRIRSWFPKGVAGVAFPHILMRTRGVPWTGRLTAEFKCHYEYFSSLPPPSRTGRCLTKNEDLYFHTNSPPSSPLNVVKYALDAKEIHALLVRSRNLKLDIFVYIFGSSDKWFLRDERMSIFKIIYFSMDRIWATSVRVEKEEHRRGEEGWWWVTRFYFKRARCKKRPCIYILSFSRLSTLNIAVILPREPSVCMLKRFETGGTGIIFARLRLVSSIVSFLKMKLDSMILLEI